MLPSFFQERFPGTQFRLGKIYRAPCEHYIPSASRYAEQGPSLMFFPTVLLVEGISDHDFMKLACRSSMFNPRQDVWKAARLLRSTTKVGESSTCWTYQLRRIPGTTNKSWCCLLLPEGTQLNCNYCVGYAVHWNRSHELATKRSLRSQQWLANSVLCTF